MMAGHSVTNGTRLVARWVLICVLTLVALPGLRVVGQSPGPTPVPEPSSGVIRTGDPRSEGEGPGIVGSPLGIAVGVVGLGLLAAGGTALYVRVTREE